MENENKDMISEEREDMERYNREPTREEMKSMSREEIKRTTNANQYLKQSEMETKEERERRQAKVKDMLKKVRDSQVGVTDSTLNGSFKEGAGIDE